MPPETEAFSFSISTLIFYENSLIGLLAFVPGIVLGMLFSQILEAVLLALEDFIEDTPILQKQDA